MSDLFKFLLSLTIILPAVVGIFRYKNADPAYRPFLYYIFISLFNELWVGLYLNTHTREIRTLNWHIFNLLEWLMLLVQFYFWGRFKKARSLFYVILICSLVGWAYENFIYSTVYVFNPVFLISYSFFLVLLSVNAINSTFAQHNQILSKNGLFIICVGMLIFFIYTIIVFLFMAMDTRYDKQLIQRIFNIRVYINALANIIYAIGIYYIPARGVHDAFFKSNRKLIS